MPVSMREDRRECVNWTIWHRSEWELTHRATLRWVAEYLCPPRGRAFLTAFDDLAGHGRVLRLTAQNCTTKKLTHLDQNLPMAQLAVHFGDSLKALYNEYVKKCDTTRPLPALSFGELFESGESKAPDFVIRYLQSIGRYVRPDLNFEHYLFKSVETPYLDDYEKMFPQMKFIHIVRNPIAVCSSQKRSLMENKALPAHYLGYDWLACMLNKRWLPHARYILMHRRDIRHIVVLYEDLVNAPEREIGRIATWLGLEPPSRPSTQTVFYDQDMQDWGFNPSKKGVATPVSVMVNLQQKNNYEEVLTPLEIDLINHKTGPYLAQLGYEKSSDPSRLRLWSSLLVPEKGELMNCTTLGSKLRGVRAMLCRRSLLFR